MISYDAAAFTTAGNIIYFGDDHNDPSKAANWTLTCPTSGAPVILVSADRTQSTPTYKIGTGNQLSSLGGAYTLTIDGAHALHGMCLASGSDITLLADANEAAAVIGCTLKPGAAKSVALPGYFGRVQDVTIDCAADTTGTSADVIIDGPAFPNAILGLTVLNAGNRTGQILTAGACAVGGDVSAATGSGVDIVGATAEPCYASNLLTAATWSPADIGSSAYTPALLVNCGPADDPTALYWFSGAGADVSTTAVYRSGGATVEGVATAWLVTTQSYCSESAPHITQWIYFAVSSAGSKAISIYITNDTGDLTTAEAWIEVQYLGTANEAEWKLASDRRATITTAAAAQTDDTTSTWNGAGPAYTYKQLLSATVTIGEEGLCRARVAIGKASIAGSSYLYIDPQVFVDGVAAGTGAYLVPVAGIVDYTCAGGSSPRIGDRTGGLR